MISWQKALLVVLALTLLSTTACTTYQTQGGTAGGAMGGIAGAILDRKNPWRGGVIGAALGALAGATISEVSVQGARQAASADRPVEYRTEDGRGRYRAEPVGHPNAQTRCKKVREKIYENDRLVRDHVREVCEGEKLERNY
jgi:glycine zipper 2TM protein